MKRDEDNRLYMDVHGDRKLFIDLLPAEAIEIIKESEFDDVSISFPKFRHEKKEYYLARTDLTDDVCTGPPLKYERPGDIDSFRVAVIDKIQNSYGVRFRPNGCFAIIDSWSDG